MKQAILFFIRYPELGKVKTRLAADFGDEKTKEVYTRFVEDLLETLRQTKKDIRVCAHPKEKIDAIQEWIKQDHIEAQGEGNLGEKLVQAFQSAFEDGYDQVIVIGSDAPDLPQGLFEKSFEALKSSEVVIGPAEDGGYYLIGFKKEAFSQEFFQGIDWSTEKVYLQTLERLKGKQVAELPKWSDVDTIQDLLNLVERNEHGWFANSKTMKLLIEGL